MVLLNGYNTGYFAEDEGSDMSIIVASLTQMCCDPFYRTTTGEFIKCFFCTKNGV